jgi:hypothetical protein
MTTFMLIFSIDPAFGQLGQNGRDAFDRMDRNKDNVIEVGEIDLLSVDDLRREAVCGYRHQVECDAHLKEHLQSVKENFKAVDTDRNGRVSFMEFEIARMGRIIRGK